MAISKTVLNTQNIGTLYAWMKENLEGAYFASVELGESVNYRTPINCFDGDDNLLFEIGYTSLSSNPWDIKSHISSGSSWSRVLINEISSSNGAVAEYGATCSSAVMLYFSSTTASGTAIVAFTKTNNDETAIIVGRGTSTAKSAGSAEVARTAWSDQTVDSIGFDFNPLPGNQTVLCPFFTNPPEENTSYTPNAFWMPMTEFPDINYGKIKIGETTYMTNGVWAFAD